MHAQLAIGFIFFCHISRTSLYQLSRGKSMPYLYDHCCLNKGVSVRVARLFVLFWLLTQDLEGFCVIRGLTGKQRQSTVCESGKLIKYNRYARIIYSL